MVKFDCDNSPNAALFISALRSLGYDNHSAINDIADNALDAGANTIHIRIDDKKEWEISITDDGRGMDEDTLDEALKLGSIVDRNSSIDLGKFGMGLSTASISIARRVEILTKQEGSDLILKSIQDIDELIEQNKFIKYVGKASEEDKALWSEYLGDAQSGTIIRMINCDKITNRNIKQFSSRLIKEIGRVFREFIHANRNIIVNDKTVEPFDIFMLDDGGEIYSDETYSVDVKDEDGEKKTETIRIRLGLLPDFDQKKNRELKINTVTQGFYVLRNNREITSGDTLGLFTRHNSYNRIRGEVYFSAELDERMGVNFQKKGIDMDQSISDRIEKDVKHQITAMHKLVERKRKATESSEVNHTPSEQYINKRSPLLKTPKENPEEKKSNAGQSGDGRGKDKAPRKLRQTPKVRFESLHLGKVGHIYEARMQGKTAIVAWNVDHPFYEKFVVGTQGDRDLANSVDYLAYALATAELTITNDDTLEVIEEFKNIMAMNMNTLLR